MGDENYLYSSFEERLKSLKLTEEEQASYIEKNASAIKESIFPSYSLLKNGLAALRTSGKNNNGLCYLPKGREYYENVVASETGSSRTIPQLQQLTQAQMLDDLKAMQTVLAASTQVPLSPPMSLRPRARYWKIQILPLYWQTWKEGLRLIPCSSRSQHPD